MQYETALKLKEHGFPQGFSDNDLPAIIPTLEELIDACGDRFAYVALDKHKGFRARGDGGDSGVLPPYYGSTPTEAVANLWLALNAKQN